MHAVRLMSLLVASLALAGCGGGTKLVKQPAPVPESVQPLAQAADAALSARLDFVVVRNGPGAWAKNADWDEYLLRVQNLGSAPVQIEAVTVVDSQGHENRPLDDRSALVSASRQATRRYRDAGLKLEAGRGGGSLVAAGVGAGVVAYGAATAAATSAALSGGVAGGGAAAAAGGLVLAAPVLVGMGIARAVNNSKVDNRIEARATKLPLAVAPGAQVALDVFFPLSPSPRQVVVHYHDGTASQRLVLETTQALHGLHLKPASAARN